MIKEHERIVLNVAVSAEGLEAGDVGKVLGATVRITIAPKGHQKM